MIHSQSLSERYFCRSFCQGRSNAPRRHFIANAIARIRQPSDGAKLVGSPERTDTSKCPRVGSLLRKTVTLLREGRLIAYPVVRSEIFIVGSSIWRDIPEPRGLPLPESRWSTRSSGYGQCSVGG